MKDHYRVWINLHDKKKFEALLRINGIYITCSPDAYFRSEYVPVCYDTLMSGEDELMLQLSIDCVILNRKDDATDLRTKALEKVRAMV